MGHTAISMLEVPALGTVAGAAPRLRTQKRAGFIFPLDSPIVVRSEGRRDRAIRRGQVAAVPVIHSVVIYAHRRASVLGVDMPAAQLEEHTGAIGDQPVHERSAIRLPMERFLLGVLNGPEDLGSLSEYFIEKLICEMAVSLIVENRGQASLAVPEGDGHRRAVSYIAANATDPSLRPNTVARHLNVSTRQLQRWFLRHGTTPSAQIRRQRVTAALAGLTFATESGTTIERVAHDAGFAGGAAFRRALHELGYPMPSRITPSPDRRGSNPTASARYARGNAEEQRVTDPEKGDPNTGLAISGATVTAPTGVDRRASPGT